DRGEREEHDLPRARVVPEQRGEREEDREVGEQVAVEAREREVGGRREEDHGEGRERVEAEGGAQPLPRHPGQRERGEEEQQVERVPRRHLLARGVAGERSLAAREVEDELGGAAASALDRLPETSD